MSTRVHELDALDDYASGAMADDEARAFEEEMFATAPDNEALKYLDRTVRTANKLLRRGGWSIGSTREDVDRLIAENPRVKYVDLGETSGVKRIERWADDLEFVIVRLGVDLRGVASVDVEVEDPAIGPLKVFRDVNYDPKDLALYAICEAPLARLAWGRPRVITRIVGERDGRREKLAEFETVSSQ